MELLESALKNSIDWSMDSRRARHKASSSAVQLMNTRLRDESHIRAFISHFKIELNKLIGLKSCNLNSQSRDNIVGGAGDDDDENEDDEDDDEEDSLSERDSIDTEDNEEAILPVVRVQFGRMMSRSTRPNIPGIKFNGKDCGLYNINEQTDDDEELERYSKKLLQRRVVGGERSAQVLDDIDDGYRSLSRGSFRSNLLQQLNDIKSRLIDLVDEINQIVQSRLDRQELEAYERRRDALIAKLDSLIDSSVQRVPASGTPPSIVPLDCAAIEATEIAGQQSLSPASSYSNNRSANMSSGSSSDTNPLSDGYEEQVHVINYNYKHRQRSSNYVNRSTIKCPIGQPLVSNSSATRVNVATTSNIYPIDRGQPIDFGAMMRDYEANSGNMNKIRGEAKTVNDVNMQHVASTSSSSHTSSSSSFL